MTTVRKVVSAILAVLLIGVLVWFIFFREDDKSTATPTTTPSTVVVETPDSTLAPTPDSTVPPTTAVVQATVPPTQVPTTATPTATPAGTSANCVGTNDTSSLVNPSLFSGDTTGTEEADTLQVGVNDCQIGIIHAFWTEWNGNVSGSPCALVVLQPGWYPNLTIENGKLDVYDVPLSDYEGWVNVLVAQRAQEQNDHFGCSHDPTQVVVWTSS